MEEYLKYIKDNLIEIIGILLAYFSLIVPIRQYLGQKELEEKDKRFNNYHRLMKELVSPEGDKLMIDRQIAVVFELRNYPEYYELSQRILGDLLIQLKGQTRGDRLTKEINLTLAFINRRN